MVTPLIDLLQEVLSGGGDFGETLLREHGYNEIDAPDIQEAILALADSVPLADSARLIEVADNLTTDGPLGLEGAAEALREAQVTYESIVEAEADVEPVAGIGTDAETDDDLDLDLDIEDHDESSVSVSVSVDGDDDPDIDVDVSGDDDPSVDIVVNGEEVGIDDLDAEDAGFLGDMAEGLASMGESEVPEDAGESDGFELGFD